MIGDLMNGTYDEPTCESRNYACCELFDDADECHCYPPCPTDGNPDSDLIGCGSRNVQWDPHDKVFDCLNCGLWFTPAALALTRTQEAPNAR